jgi:hypothetical protein
MRLLSSERLLGWVMNARGSKRRSLGSSNRMIEVRDHLPPLAQRLITQTGVGS